MTQTTINLVGETNSLSDIIAKGETLVRLWLATPERKVDPEPVQSNFGFFSEVSVTSRKQLSAIRKARVNRAYLCPSRYWAI